MQREMRRKDRKMPDEEALQLLKNNRFGVLAMADAACGAYAVPLSYIFMDGCIYFHSARKGHKVDNFKENPHVCFNVVGENHPMYLKNFTTTFESVTVFGSVFEVTDPEEKTKLLHAICQKYLPEHMDKAETDIAGSLSVTAVFGIKISYFTGKQKKAT